jgi:hypothetical protein
MRALPGRFCLIAGDRVGHVGGTGTVDRLEILGERAVEFVCRVSRMKQRILRRLEESFENTKD